MTTTVIVATACIRDGLLDLLTDVAGGMHEALLPPAPNRHVRAAQARYAKAKAIGDLLDDIGWMSGELTPPYRLDLATHGWAATVALERVIAREHISMCQNADMDEAEASGHAGALRLDAERELDLIRAACERAKIIIMPPGA